MIRAVIHETKPDDVMIMARLEAEHSKGLHALASKFDVVNAFSCWL